MSAELDPAVCRQVLGQKSKSFAWASKLLSSESRDAAAMVYAWCRRCDDAIDDSKSSDRHEALDRMRAELAAIYRGDPQQEPVLRAFQGVVFAFGIPSAYPLELLLGMEMDLQVRTYATIEHLLLYCYRVAGTVGLMMSHVLGVNSPRALRPAVHLGMAMQLTNIARDVVEDWQMGRLYVPLCLLGEEDADAWSERMSRPLLPDQRRRFAEGVRALLLEADRYYASADRGMKGLSFRSALSIRAARFIYAAIGEKVRLRGYDIFAGRARTRGWTKVVLILRATVVTLAELPGRLYRPFRRALPLPLMSYPDDVLPL